MGMQQSSENQHFDDQEVNQYFTGVSGGGSKRKTVSSLKDVVAYSDSVYSKDKVNLIKAIAKDLKSVLGLKHAASNDVEEIVNELSAKLPDPKKVVIKANDDKVAKVIMTMAETINKKAGRRVVNTDESPQRMADQIDEFMDSLFTTVHSEFTAVSADVENRIHLLELLRKAIEGAVDNMARDAEATGNEVLKIRIGEYKNAAHILLDETSRQIELLSRTVSSQIKPINRDIATLLAENTDLRQMMNRVKSEQLNAPNWLTRFTSLISTSSLSAQLAGRVHDMLKKVGMSVNEYSKLHNPAALRSKLNEILINKHNVSDQDVELFESAKEFLTSIDIGTQNQIVEMLNKKGGNHNSHHQHHAHHAHHHKHGGVEEDDSILPLDVETRSNTKLGKRLAQKIKTKRTIKIDFQREVELKFNQLLRVVEMVVRQFGISIKDSDNLAAFVKSVKNLSGPEYVGFYDALLGLRTDVYSKYMHDKFIKQLVVVREHATKLQKGPAGDLFKDIANRVDDIKTFVDKYGRALIAPLTQFSVAKPQEGLSPFVKYGRGEDNEDNEAEPVQQEADQVDALQHPEAVVQDFSAKSLLRKAISMPAVEAKLVARVDDALKAAGCNTVEAKHVLTKILDELLKDEKQPFEGGGKKGKKRVRGRGEVIAAALFGGADPYLEGEQQPAQELGGEEAEAVEEVGGEDAETNQAIEQFAEEVQHFVGGAIKKKKAKHHGKHHKKHHGKHGGSTGDEVLDFDNEMATADELPAYNTLEKIRNQMDYAYRMMRVRNALKANVDQLSALAPEYEVALADFVDKQIGLEYKDFEARLTSIKAIEDHIKTFRNAGVAVKDIPEARSTISGAREYYKIQYDTKVEFYNAIMSIEYYLINFTNNVSKDIKLLSDLSSILDSAKIIAKWFTESSGNNLASLIDSFSNNAGLDRTANLINDRTAAWFARAENANKHYYQYLGSLADANARIAATGTGALINIDKSETLRKILNRAKRAVDSVSVMQNLFAMFTKLAERLGTASTIGKDAMTPGQIYNAFQKYMFISAFSNAIHDNQFGQINPDLEKAAADRLAQNPPAAPAAAIANNNYILKVGLDSNPDANVDFARTDKLFMMSLKAITAKIFVVMGAYTMFAKPLDTLHHHALSTVRLAIGGSAKIVEVNPDATELYLRLPLLAEFYRDLFGYGIGSNPEGNVVVANADDLIVSMLPEVLDVWRPLLTIIFDKARYVESGHYSDSQAQELIRECNNLYSRYHKSGESPEETAMKVLTEFVAEINRRIGVVKRKELQEYLKQMRKTGRESDAPYGAKPDDKVDFDLLQQSTQPNYKPLTSMKYASSTRGLEMENPDDLEFAHMKTAFEEIRKRVDDMLLGNEGKLDPSVSFNDAVRHYRANLASTRDNEGRYNTIMRMIQGGDNVAELGADKLLMFHEAVIAPLSVLENLKSDLEKFRELIRKTDVKKMEAEILDAIHTNAVDVGDGAVIVGSLAEAYRRGGHGNIMCRRHHYGARANLTFNADLNDRNAAARAGANPLEFNPDRPETYIHAANNAARLSIAAIVRWYLNRQEIMYDLIQGMFNTCCDLSGLIELRVENGKFVLNYDRLKEFIVATLGFVRDNLDKFRLLPAFTEIIKKLEEEGAGVTGIYKFEHDLVECLMEGIDDYDNKPEQMSLAKCVEVANESYRRLTRQWYVAFTGVGPVLERIRPIAELPNDNDLALAKQVQMNKLAKWGRESYEQVFARLTYWEHLSGLPDLDIDDDRQEFNDAKFPFNIMHRSFDDKDADFTEQAKKEKLKVLNARQLVNIEELQKYDVNLATLQNANEAAITAEVLGKYIARIDNVRLNAATHEQLLAGNAPATAQDAQLYQALYKAAQAYTSAYRSVESEQHLSQPIASRAGWYKPEGGEFIDISANADAGLLVKFNEVLAKYLYQCTDATDKRLYLQTIEKFITDFNNHISENISIRDFNIQNPAIVGYLGGARQNVVAAGVSNALGDPTIGSLLFTSLSLYIKGVVKTVDNGKRRHVYDSLADVPAYVKENMRANLPIFIKMFDLMCKKAELIRALVGKTDISLQRMPRTNVDGANGVALLAAEFRGATIPYAAVPADVDALAAARAQLSTKEVYHEEFGLVIKFATPSDAQAYAGAAAHRTRGTSDDERVAYNNYLSAVKGVNALHNVAGYIPENPKLCSAIQPYVQHYSLDFTKHWYTLMLNSIISGATTIRGCAYATLRELEDVPLYFETHQGAIDEYRERAKHLPLMPLSLANFALKNRAALDASVETHNKFLLPVTHISDPAFKFNYGTRGILGRPDAKLSMDMMPGVRELIAAYNGMSDPMSAIDENLFAGAVEGHVNLLRYVVDNRIYKSAIGTKTFAPYGLADGLAVSKYMTYATAGSTNLYDLVALAESEPIEESKKTLVKVLGHFGGRANISDRKRLRIYNILDIGVVPINYMTLISDIPFTGLLNYSYTYDMMVNETIGRVFGTQINDNLRVNPKQMLNTFLKNPLGFTFNAAADLDNIAHLLAGSGDNLPQGFNKRIKYAYDQLASKVLIHQSRMVATDVNGVVNVVPNAAAAPDTDADTPLNRYNIKLVKELLWLTLNQAFIRVRIAEEVQRMADPVVAKTDIFAYHNLFYSPSNAVYDSQRFGYQLNDGTGMTNSLVNGLENEEAGLDL